MSPLDWPCHLSPCGRPGGLGYKYPAAVAPPAGLHRGNHVGRGGPGVESRQDSSRRPPPGPQGARILAVATGYKSPSSPRRHARMRAGARSCQQPPSPPEPPPPRAHDPRARASIGTFSPPRLPPALRPPLPPRGHPGHAGSPESPPPLPHAAAPASLREPCEPLPFSPLGARSHTFQK